MVRPPVRFTIAELSGALADLGVMLPLLITLVALGAISGVGAFTVVGSAYLLSAAVYRLPVPVQPLKAFAATAIALNLPGQVIVAGTYCVAGVFLVLAVTGAIELVVKAFSKPITRGIQLGLGILLVQAAWSLATGPDPTGVSSWSVTIVAAIVLIVALRLRSEWAALCVIAYGVVVAIVVIGAPSVRLAFTTPTFVASAGAAFAPAFWFLVVPQIPLSLANSVVATADAARQYFGEHARKVTPRRLVTTMGVMNLAAALVGGLPLCHGSGGVTAHYRLGARTAGAPIILGALFLTMGLIGSTTLIPVMRLIPRCVLGVLLAYVGIQHVFLARDLRGVDAWTVAVAVALVAAVTSNLAIGCAAGFLAQWGIIVRRRWHGRTEPLMPGDT